MTTKQRITNTIEKWYLIEPLYFAIWTTHELSINPNIQNILVGQGLIEYNPAFIQTLDNKTLDQVLQFEVMRIILKHPYLRRKENKTVAYLASNITIQEYQRTTLDFPYAEQIFQTKEYDRKYFEFYYQKLLEQQQDSSSSTTSQSPQTDSGAGAGANAEQQSEQKSENESEDEPTGQQQNDQKADTSDESKQQQTDQEHPTSNASSNTLEQYTDPQTSGLENTESWDTNEYYNNQINDKIEAALENNAWGTLPSHIQELILATLKPKINYREILKTFRASIISVNRVLTRMKPSRRYGFLYLGSRRDFCTKLLFAVDVSGSVSNKALKQAFSIINQLFKYGIERVEVLQFDSEIKGKPLTLKKAKHKIKVIGRGGTHFQPVIDYIDKNKDYDGLIIFTDGWAPIPKAPKNKRTRILWLFDNEHNYRQMKDQLKPIGGSTFIKET